MDYGEQEPWILGHFLGIVKAHILTKTIVGDNRGIQNSFWLITYKKSILVLFHLG